MLKNLCVLGDICEKPKEATISKMETVQNNNINIGSRSGGCIRWVKNKKSSCL